MNYACASISWLARARALRERAREIIPRIRILLGAPRERGLALRVLVSAARWMVIVRVREPPGHVTILYVGDPACVAGRDLRRESERERGGWSR